MNASKGHSPQNDESWEAFCEAAEKTEDRGRQDELFVESCLAYSRIFPASAFKRRPGGAPAGRPSTEVVRAAGRSLLSHFPEPVSGLHELQRLIGLIASVERPAGKRLDSGEWEISAARRVADLALREARETRDPDILIWVLSGASYFAHQAADGAAALSLAEEGLNIFESTDWAGTEWSLAAAAGSPQWLPSTDAIRLTAAANNAQAITQNLSSIGDLERWRTATQRRLELTEPLSRGTQGEGLKLYGMALAGSATFARAVGDMRGQIDAENILTSLAAHDTPERDAARSLLATQCNNAAHRRDWSQLLVHSANRLQLFMDIVEQNRQQVLGPDEAQDVQKVLEVLNGRGERSWPTGIGNSCVGQVKAMHHLGVARSNSAALEEALRLLDVAEYAYGGRGANQLADVRLNRTRLLLHGPGDLIGDEEATEEFLTVSRVATAGPTRANAALEAVRCCKPGDGRVRERIEELLDGPSSAHHSKFRAGLALWHHRTLAAASTGTDEDWEGLLTLAKNAGQALSWEGRQVDPLLATECWLIAWDAHRRANGKNRLMERLAIALEAVHCLTIHLLTITDAGERSRVAAEYAHIYPDAAELAISLRDAVAAEIIMEAARRERVGVLLGELSRNPAVGHLVREAAHRILAANAPPEIRDFPEEKTQRSWSAGTTKEILANRRSASAEAAQIIGPAAILSDFSQLPIPRAERLVARANSDGRPAAVLQFYRPASQPQRLFWSVTVPQEKTICGEANFPDGRLPILTESGFWTKFELLAESLIPAPLSTYLLDCRSRWPVQLTIVPTGLLGIPFDNLTVTNLASGYQWKLVECADVVLTGSLAMTEALSAKQSERAGKRWLKVYDHANLLHTRIESDAMEANHDPVEDFTGATSVHTALAPEDHDYGVLALGVHGTGDPAGWGQTKIFPDGTKVTAAESLQWTAPRTGVLSSCYSSLETTDGTEVSGFPAALLLRGATTVIGSLDRIDDASTAEIMAQFWRLLGMGHPPVHALAQAKRQWLAEQDDRWGKPWFWAPLIAYGTN